MNEEDGYYDENGTWVYNSGYYDGNGTWVYNNGYDPAGYYDDNGIWVDNPGYGANALAQPAMERQDSFEEAASSSSGSAWGTMKAVDAGIQDAIGEQKIPSRVADWVQEDVWELRQLSDFWCADPDFTFLEKGNKKIRLRIGFNTRYLNIEAEQARAWAINPSKKLIIELIFNTAYWNPTDPLTTTVSVNIGQPENNQEDYGVLIPIKLSWTLGKQIKDHFISNVEIAKTNGKDMMGKAYDLQVVKDLMDATCKTFQECVGALLEAKGSESKATAILTNPQAQLRLQRQRSEDGKKTNQNRRRGFLSNVFDRKSNRVSTLANRHNCSEEVAQLAMDMYPDEKECDSYMSQRHNVRHLQMMADGEDASIRDSTAALENELSKHNNLVSMLIFFSDKIRTINQFCITCDEKVAIPGLKPSICGSELCRLRYEQLGLGFDLGAEVRENPEIVDVLISFAYAAGKNSRMSFAAPHDVSVSVVSSNQDHKSSNFMSGPQRTEMKELHFLQGTVPEGKVFPDKKVFHTLPGCDEVDNINYTLFNEVLGHCPSVSELQTMGRQGVNFSTELAKKHPLLYPLIRWIIVSNKAHIRKLLPEEQIADMNTDYQFVLLSSTPEREQDFRRKRTACEARKGKGNGTIWAWHGSAFPNWHNILRIGLKNMSNTKYMSAGAAYGPGIYMAKMASTSLGYCRQAQGWSKSMFGNRNCLALCEVINNVKPPHPYYVVTDETKIVTRFLFCMANNSCSADAMTLKSQGKIPSLS